jgi:hypothetical protein
MPYISFLTFTFKLEVLYIVDYTCGRISTNLKQLFTQVGEITGQSFRISDTMRDNIKEAGFVNVVEKVFMTPLGGWPADPRLKEIGQWTLLGFDIGLEGYVMAGLTRALKVSVA